MKDNSAGFPLDHNRRSGPYNLPFPEGISAFFFLSGVDVAKVRQVVDNTRSMYIF